MVAIAEMYVKGISTRRVTGVLEKMCGLEISSTQVSRAAALLDDELEKWRQRKLGETPYLILDAHYEKVRINGSVQSCAIFTAKNIDSGIYYPIVMHQQKCFAHLNYKTGDFPQAEKATQDILALPIYPELTREMQQTVVEAIVSFYAP
jgi:dTDP-4-amino-4,6-dideoxygalactose transaminase